MKKYTVLSFNFNGYDLVRDPEKVDPDAEYVYVTDTVDQSRKSVWQFKTDPKLDSADPIYASYYVRYHPFEYVSTDIVVIVDGSVQIHDSLAPIAEEFAESGADFAPMLSNYHDDEHKMNYFMTRLNRVSRDDIAEMNEYIKSLGQTHWRGSICCAVILLRKTPVVERLLETVWNKLLVLGNNGVPNRMDEVVLHKELYAFAKEIKLFITSIQVMQSTYMTYCKHGVREPHKLLTNYDQMYYVCNMPVSPLRFSKAINYPRTYRYRTEAMLLTRHLNADDLDEWLDWHINRCGFDRIHVFDNESDYDVKAVCEKYGNKITYELVEGQPRQYKLYDGYINWRSSAEWVMPIDDDEYLDLGEFKNVGEMLDYYSSKFQHIGVFAIRWKHLFPKDFHTERTGKVLEYCTEEDTELAKKFMHLGDRTIKCIVKRNGFIHYEETWETPSGGHVPKHSSFFGALTCDEKTVTGCGVSSVSNITDERVRLLHCRYKGPSDWKKWHGKGTMTVSDALPKERSFVDMEF